MLTIMQNASAFRCKTLAWMREPEWKWHIVHTDWMRDLLPKILPQSSGITKLLSTALGFDELTNEPNGPNNDTNTGLDYSWML